MLRDEIGDELLDDPPQRDEAAIRAMLEQSRGDVAEGCVVPMEALLERMRAAAERLQREQDTNARPGTPHA